MKSDQVIVLFEVTIKEGCMDEFQKMGGALKEELAGAEGFIAIERFSSVSRNGKFLTKSIWENEEAVTKWRNRINHRRSQQKGRESIFEGYKISVASLLREYTNDDRIDGPQDSNDYFGL